jgi:hypothetical protein
VPRFFFDLREGVRFTPDDDGLEFPNIDAAECEAADTAAEIGRDLLPRALRPPKTGHTSTTSFLPPLIRPA